MKTIQVFEFKDLTKNIQKIIYNQKINEIVDCHIEVLNMEFQAERITETEYYNYIGCSKHYAESTSWFIPSCYYEKNKQSINKSAKEDLQNTLFTENGQFIQYTY